MVIIFTDINQLAHGNLPDCFMLKIKNKNVIIFTADIQKAYIIYHEPERKCKLYL